MLPPCLMLSPLHLASQHQVTGQGSPQIPQPARRSCPVSLSGQHPDPSQVVFSRDLPAHSGCHLDLGSSGVSPEAASSPVRLQAFL